MEEPQQRPVTALEVPWTIKVYAALYVLGIVAYLVLSDDPLQGLGYTLIEVLLVWGMVRGARVAWIVALVFTVFGVLWTIGVVLGQGPSDMDLPLKVVQGVHAVIAFGLLLHPQTRAWCHRKLRLAT